MICEMCGKNTELVNAIVEGAMLKVCKDCAKFGKIIETPKPKIEVKPKIVEIEKEEIIETIVDDYSRIIKEAREQRNLTQEELAKAIAEKESVIHKLESGQFKPSIELAKKLERFLKIKLVIEYEEIQTKKLDFKDKTLTVGDLLSLRKNE